MLTDNQKKALDFRHHMSVTANAGAGKTTVLVRRFVEILLQTEARVNEIVAITFTEKAASELKSKIATEVEEKIRTAEQTRERIQLEQIRDQLVSANIGTIHSFCAQLLREYPVGADVDAAFTVLEGADQQLLEHEALRETFEKILNDSEKSAESENVLNVLRMFGRRTVDEYLALFLRKREQIDRLLKEDGCLAENLSEENILGGWHRMIESAIIRQIDTCSWKESVQHILRLASGKSVSEVSTLLKDWHHQLSPKQKIDRYSKIANLILTRKRTLRKEFIGADTDIVHLDGKVQKITDHLSSVSDLIESMTSDEGAKANRILLRTMRTLLHVYKRIVDAYEAKKAEYGQLDFEDLQMKTWKLLPNDELRRVISSRFKFFMIDEFQDTNRLQYEILEQLLSGFTSGNLFIVGDPKQSIYGFRDAEVKIFEDIKRSIGASDGGTGKEIILGESFRLLPNLVDFVNRVFSRILSDDSCDYDVAYDELIQGRNNRAEGGVELLLIPTQRGSSDQDDENGDTQSCDAIMRECQMIASRIMTLVDQQHIIYHGKSEERRPFEFKDAAILLRTRTHIRAVERALLEQQIPYVLSGGIGFYQTQEVYDFLNYFNFLLNPDDDVALTGILRSPFFVISDAELFEISLHRGQSFWLKLQAYAKDRDATPELRRALRVLKHHREIVHRLPIQLLVQRIFLQTGWRGTVTGLPSGGQNLANIQKLFRLAQEFEGKGFTTIYDFVRRLRTLAETEDREGQAASTIDGNYVKVMTIHAAKGLEFPVVFVPFAHQKFRYDRTPLLDPHLGIAYKVRDDDDFDRELTPSLFHLLQQRSNQKREAEEKRIFYVACTRARDAIILSGQWDVESSYPSFLRWTLDSLRLDVSTVRNGEHLFPESSLKVLGGSDGQLDVVQTRHRLRMSISFSEPAQLVFPQVQSESAGVFRPRRIFTDHLVGRSYGEVVSATQIKTFLECPTKYYLKYHLGVPERSSSPYDFDEEEESNDLILGEVEGLLTHALLQTIYDTSLAEEHIREKASQLVRTNSLGSYSPNESLVEAVAQNALGFINSSFGRTVLDASETRTELSLSAAYATDYLTGTIDRLYKDKSGCWCIVDYKTDKVKRAEIRKSAEIYKPQLLTYSILVKKLYRQNSVLATLVFLRHPSEPIHFNFNESDLERFETIVNQIIGNIKTYDFNRELDICESCSYRKANECLIPPSLTAPKRD